MKKIILIVVVVFGVLIGTMYFLTQSAKQAVPTPPVQTATNPVITYFCNEGSLTANYSPTMVSISTFDGRKFELPQVRSGSGVRYEEGSKAFLTKGNNAYLQESGMTTYNNCIAGTVTSFKGMNTFVDGNKMFSFIFPNTFILSGGEMGFTQTWRNQSTESGLVLAKVLIPKSFQPKTNFSEAVFTVGTSAEPAAVSNCLIGADPVKTEINRFPMTKFVTNDAGAGNFYKTTSYRALRNDQCYAIEYTIHTTNIGNYSPDQGITEYNAAKIDAALDAIVQSYVFVQ